MGLLVAGCTTHGPQSSPGTGRAAASGLGLGRASGLPSPVTQRPSLTRRIPSTVPTTTAVKPVREVPGTCPYISDQEVADIEGNRVGRSTVVTTTPRGCRFYFQYDDHHMTAQIAIKSYPTALAAYNRVARTGGSHAFSTAGIGDAAVLYQTRFYPPDGNRDWACTFARGRLVVTVETDQTDPSTNARNLARTIVGRL